MRLRQMELFMILLGLSILGMMALAHLRRIPKDRMAQHARVRCVSNLKQVGLAYQLWAGDHDDKFPFEVSTNSGGTKEYVRSLDTYRHFAVMSNDLGSPRVIVCPADYPRPPVMVFASLSNSNLSYFVNLSARERDAVTLLAGDRNLLLSVSSTNFLLKWDTGLHERQGNVCLSDGSVHGPHGTFQTNILNPHYYRDAQLLIPR